MYAVLVELIWPDAHWSSCIGKELLKIDCSESSRGWGMAGHAMDAHMKHA